MLTDIQNQLVENEEQEYQVEHEGEDGQRTSSQEDGEDPEKQIRDRLAYLAEMPCSSDHSKSGGTWRSGNGGLEKTKPHTTKPSF